MARQILAINNPNLQKQLLDMIIANDWSVRKAEQFVIGYKLGDKDRKNGVAKTRTETGETKQLAKRLGTQVEVKTTAKGGQLIIRYRSDDDLKRIYEQLL